MNHATYQLADYKSKLNYLFTIIIYSKFCFATIDRLKMTGFRKIGKFASSRQMREGGGFLVYRPIGDKIDSCDPFLMLDHLAPVTYGPGEAVGAPDHPHRGFETVTYIIDGKTFFSV